jgi:tetratricopeptide (TPR) repeat protein
MRWIAAVRHMMRQRASAGLATLAVGCAAGMGAQESATPVASLGTVHFPISCSKDAQAGFDRGLALLHHMTYPQAREEFARLVGLEPGCAMAHWGVAMTLFQPLWPTRPGPEDIRRGRTEIRAARSLGAATERERLFLEAAAGFFREPDSLDYRERVRGWHQGMERVHAAFPEDPEAATWLALATLAVAPAAGVAREHSDRAAELLLPVYRANPNHPGAMHYLIHADDVPGREHESPEIVRRYTTIAPDNPHALHMPTHIYTRLGDWERVVEGNLRAAATALEQPAGEGGRYVWDEFPHAIEYLVYAYLQLGDTGAARAQLRRLQATKSLEPTFKTAFHLASTPARYALERKAWREAMALPPREPAWLDWDRFAWPEAVTWFARGLGAAHEGRRDRARAAAARLVELEAAAGRSGEPLFARQIAVLRLGVEGWTAHAQGHADSALALLRQAAALEATTPKPAVTPAPTLPAQELLGDLLLEQGRPKEAAAAYRRALELYPGRRNSLRGAAASP